MKSKNLNIEKKLNKRGGKQVKNVPGQKALNKQWQEFLAKAHDCLKIHDHCLVRILDRFPEMQELTVKEFLDLVREGRPVGRIEFPETHDLGIKVKKKKIIFAVSLKTKQVITLYPSPKKKSSKKVKGKDKKSKSHYHRPSAKQQAEKEINEEISA